MIDEELALEQKQEIIINKIKTESADIVRQMQKLNSEEQKLDEQIKALQKQKREIENNKKDLNTFLMDAIKFTGNKMIQTKEYDFFLRQNGGTQALEITGEVPDNYTKIIVEPDKTKIKNALKDGVELDFAHLKPRGYHLVVKEVKDETKESERLPLTIEW